MLNERNPRTRLYIVAVWLSARTKSRFIFTGDKQKCPVYFEYDHVEKRRWHDQDVLGVADKHGRTSGESHWFDFQKSNIF